MVGNGKWPSCRFLGHVPFGWFKFWKTTKTGTEMALLQISRTWTIRFKFWRKSEKLVQRHGRLMHVTPLQITGCVVWAIIENVPFALRLSPNFHFYTHLVLRFLTNWYRFSNLNQKLVVDSFDQILGVGNRSFGCGTEWGPLDSKTNPSPHPW